MAGGVETSNIAAPPAIMRTCWTFAASSLCNSDGREPLSSRIFSNPLYASLIATHGEHMTDEILTIREVAELLKLNEKTAYKLALAGEIPGFKVGGSWRFERQAIASWIKRKVEEQQNGRPT